jgi:hypothetical protein
MTTLYYLCISSKRIETLSFSIDRTESIYIPEDLSRVETLTVVEFQNDDYGSQNDREVCFLWANSVREAKNFPPCFYPPYERGKSTLFLSHP